MPLSSLAITPFPPATVPVAPSSAARAATPLTGAAPTNSVAPGAADSVSLQGATAAERPRLSERLGAIVDARLALLPGPIAAAVALCAAVPVDALGSEPATRVALDAVRRLGVEVASSALAEVTPRDEVEESQAFAAGFLLADDNPPALVARGQSLLERLEQAAPAPLQCRVNVLDGGGSMAFGKGGHNIFVSSDMFDLPDDELAATLAHERVHLLERHLPLSQVTRRVGRVLEAGAPDGARPSVHRVVLLAQAEQRRAQELGADARGADMIAAAGYDRNAMVRLLARNASDAQPATPLDEYPTAQARMAALSTPGAP